jgi:hypothetical protein
LRQSPIRTGQLERRRRPRRNHLSTPLTTVALAKPPELTISLGGTASGVVVSSGERKAKLAKLLVLWRDNQGGLAQSGGSSLSCTA